MAISLNGSTYLTGPVGGIPTAPPLTISCWFRPTASLDTSVVTLSNAQSNDDYYELGIRADGQVTAVARDSGWAPAYASGTYTVGAWTHGAAVFASETQSLAALNGASGSTLVKAATAPSGFDTAAIGRLVRPSPVTGYRGALGEVAIWSAALTASELKQLAQGVRPDRLLARRESLALYRSLVRFPAPGDLGPVFGEVGTTVVERHPALVGGGGLVAPPYFRRLFRPAGLRRGQVATAAALAGQTSVAGAAFGQVGSLGEVW